MAQPQRVRAASPNAFLSFAALIIVLHSLVYAVLLAFRLPQLADSPTNVFVVGTLALSAVAGVCYFGAVLQGAKQVLWTTFFFFIIFTANIDLYLALALLDLTELGKFYVVNGEEYFKTAWGWSSLVWDGTAHSIMQVLIAYSLLRGTDSLKLRLFWCGSVLNSMPVLLIGALSGTFSADIEPATLFNVPYVFVPLLFALKCFSEAGERDRLQAAEKGISVLQELVVAVGCFGSIVFIAVRAMVVLGSSAPVARWWKGLEPELADDFAKPQVMQNMFLFIYWYLVSLVEATHRIAFKEECSLLGGRVRLGYVAVFIAGCIAQAQFCHIIALCVEWTDYTFESRQPEREALQANIAWLAFSLLHALVWYPRSSPKNSKLD